jgi:4-amino-4-deoxy-L-arabinose transferase-like glycosyltransferase
MGRFLTPPRAVPAALGLLAILVVQGLMFIGESSQTSDEAVHLAGGYSYLTRADFRLNPEHPPLLKEIAALPLLLLELDFPGGALWEQAEEWNIGRLFVHENRVRNDTILLLGRLPMLALSVLLGWVLFRVGRRIFGDAGGLLALAIYVLDPNVVANSCLVTTDIGLTLFFFLTIVAAWRWAERPAPGRLALAGAAFGATLASKFTAVWIVPAIGTLAILLVVSDVPLPARPWSHLSPILDRRAGIRRRLGALLVAALLMAAVGAVVLAAAYFGVGLPAYWKGLTQGMKHTGEGHMAYLAGNYSMDGWWHYFLFAYALKTPIGILIILAAAAAAAFRGWRAGRRTEIVLLVPLALLLVITGLWRVNIGLRHLLPAYPFLYIAAGRLLAPPSAASRRAGRLAAAVAILGVAWTGVEAARIAPYNLTYFNAFAGGPAQGHRWLLDSNLDWGQGAKALRRFMFERNVPFVYCGFSGNSDPWYYGVRYQYAPGTGNLDVSRKRGFTVPDALSPAYLAITPMLLHAVQFKQHDPYEWLRDRETIAMPGNAWMIYDITHDIESQALLAVLYANSGSLDLADVQAHRVLRRDPGNPLARAVLDHLAGGAPDAGPRGPAADP